MSNKGILSLQVLRGVAALAVVLHHSIRSVTKADYDFEFKSSIFFDYHLITEIGSAGVDIFFVLSGFLMIYISDKYTQKDGKISIFLLHRIIRIWPLYFLVTSLLCFKLVAKYILLGESHFDLQWERLLSFFFIPSFNEAGLLQPILGVGWTLNYEVLFYCIFALSVKLHKRHLLLTITALLISVFLIGSFLPAKSIANEFLSNSIIFEFLFGALIGSAFKEHKISAQYPYVYILLGLIFLVIFTMAEPIPNLRFATIGIAAVLLFIGMLKLGNDVNWSKLSILLGNASYSIYLIHILIIYQLNIPVFRKITELSSPVSGDLVIVVMFTTSVAGGVLFYKYIETPLLEWCKNKTKALY